MEEFSNFTLLVSCLELVSTILDVRVQLLVDLIDYGGEALVFIQEGTDSRQT